MPYKAPTFRPLPLRRQGPSREGRGKTAERGYDGTWRKLRDAYLAQHPLCECDQCIEWKQITAAEVVDHRIPIAERPELRLEWSNLRAMSKQHHDMHTARTRGFGRSRKL